MKNHEMITIGTGRAMENSKMVKEDVVEEHNGVYGGKWYIVSPEGFDLQEGLEYLKGGWSHDKKGTTCIYTPVIKVSCIPLYVALSKVCNTLEIINVGANIEFEKCTEKSKNGQFGVLMGMGFFNLTVHACNLTFLDIKEMLDPNNSDLVHGINLSGNVFDEYDKNWDILNEVSQFGVVGDLPVDEFDLTNCGFSTTEKKLLEEKLIVGKLYV